MKKYAVKRQDDSIYVIQCKHSPENFMEDSENDTLMNEITESNPLPDKKYRDSWVDSDGDVALEDVDKDAKDRMDKLNAIRDHRQPLLDEADIELRKHEDSDGNAVGSAVNWKSYRISLRNITDVYKDESGNPTEDIDEVEDPAEDVTWPTKPS